MTAQTQPEALRRVQAYIARLKQSQRIDRECISVFDGGAPSEVSLLTSDIEWMPSRIAELEAKASENYWLLYAMKEQELWYQDELVEEAKRTAAEKLRADQMTEQHRMEAAMNAEARGELAQLREKRQLLNPQYSSADPADALDAETVKKAQRYDWLRHGDNDEKVIMRGPVAHDFVYLPRNEKLDTLIDAAMATQGEKP